MNRQSFSSRAVLLALLLCAALGSAWLLNRLAQKESKTEIGLANDPDYYMEDFTTVSMNQDGTPKNKLYAISMAHYPIDDTTELNKPKMEILRANNVPLFIVAEKGWVTSGNAIILLRGQVRMWEESVSGAITLQVDTTDVRVLVDQDYAETDQYATIVSKKTTITGTGMRAHFKDSRLEVLHHERTTITQTPGA